MQTFAEALEQLINEYMAEAQRSRTGWVTLPIDGDYVARGRLSGR